MAYISPSHGVTLGFTTVETLVLALLLPLGVIAFVIMARRVAIDVLTSLGKELDQ